MSGTGTDQAQAQEPAETPPKDRRVTDAELARDLLKLDLERRQLQKSIVELDQPATDLRLGILPKTTTKTATVDDKGGGAAAALESAKAVSAQATEIARQVVAATSAEETIVLLAERNVSDPTIAAVELRRRIEALLEVLTAAIPVSPETMTAAIPGGDGADREGGQRHGRGDEAQTEEDVTERADRVAAADGGDGSEDTTTGVTPAPPAVRPEMQLLSLAIGVVDAVVPSVGIHGRETDLPDQGLRDAVAGAIAASAKDRSVIVPSMVSASESTLYDKVIALAKKCEEARRIVRGASQENASDEQRIAVIDVAIGKADSERVKAVSSGDDEAARRLSAFIEANQNARASISDAAAHRARAAVIADVTSVQAAADTFLAAVLSNADGGSMLQRAAVAEKILRADRNKRRFLHVDITAMGGDVLTSSSFAASEIKVRGMAQTTFLLTDADGKVLASGTQQNDSGDPLKVEQSVKAQLGLIAAVALALIAAVIVVGIVLRLVGVVT